MRTTLHLDDDIVEAVREYAENRSTGMGKAVSELVRRGLTAPFPTRMVNGLVVFDVPSDEQRITSKRVKEIEAEVP